jgi:hypothetical protein
MRLKQIRMRRVVHQYQSGGVRTDAAVPTSVQKNS